MSPASAGAGYRGVVEADYYWINRERGNYRCNLCGFQYHDGDPVAHTNLSHGQAPVREGKEPTKLELVARIEERLGIATKRLWRADKATLRALLAALEGVSS